MKKFLCLFLILVFTCAISGCKGDTEREQQLQDARDRATMYDFLSGGESALYSLLPVLSYYDNASYQKAKDGAKLSEALMAEYFPSVNWQGVEFFSETVTPVIQYKAIQAYDDNGTTYLIGVLFQREVRKNTFSWYKVRYSSRADVIVEVTELK